MGVRKGRKILSRENNVSAEEEIASLEEALTRLERSVLDKQRKIKAGSDEQMDYIEQLEKENRQLNRQVEKLNQDCLTLKKGYKAQENKTRKLEKLNDSVGKELTATIMDLDRIIAQESVH